MNTYEQFLVEKIWKKDKENTGNVRKENTGKEIFKSSNILIISGNILHDLIFFLPVKFRFLYIFLQMLKLQMWPTIT